MYSEYGILVCMVWCNIYIVFFSSDVYIEFLN